MQGLEKPLHPHVQRLLRDAHVSGDVCDSEPLEEVETYDQRVLRGQQGNRTTKRCLGRIQAVRPFVVEHPTVR
jgi:hypothetical protein